MIIVLSYDEYEQGTEPVIDWLINLNANFIKVTIKNLFNPAHEMYLDVSNQRLFYNNRDITDEVNVFFYRRIFKKFELKTSRSFAFKDQLEQEVTDESISLVYYLFYLFRNKTWLPSPDVVNVNKLIMLNRATDAGLQAPRTLVLNTKSGLESFFKECSGSVITKAIQKSGYYIVGKHTYFAYVNKLTSAMIEKMPSRFFPSLFQECVDKDYEVRVFYLDGEYFAVALLSANSDQTVDVKIRSKNSGSHWVPFQLPEFLKEQLSRFFKGIRLNTGSVDMIRTKTGEFVFLEVNPVGQYGSPSHYGNYYIEKRIAEWLIKKDEVYERQC